MAPHSPIPGLPLAYESCAPAQPLGRGLSRPYTQLLASNGGPLPTAGRSPGSGSGPTGNHNGNEDGNDKRLPQFTPHLPGRPRSLARSRDRSVFSFTALPTLIFALLLIMLIAVSSTMYKYDSRDQNVAELVKTAYFERDVYIASGLLMEKRQKGAGMPLSAAAADGSASATSSVQVASSTTSSAKPAKSSTFHDADDVRDPSAVKPDNGENDQKPDADPSDDGQSASAAPPAPTPHKRHWSSRGKRHGLGRRKYWY